MNQDRLFRQTRWRLASWYAGVMGVILSLSGLGLYEAIAHAHWVTLDREISSVAGTLHDSLEPLLKQPGIIEPEARRLLPDLCLADASSEGQCSGYAETKDKQYERRHAIGAVSQGNYYVRFLDKSGNLVAWAGTELELPGTADGEAWQTLTESSGVRYRHISVLLHTRDNRDWGYLQVGRSLQDWDDYLSVVTVTILVGLPLALLLVGAASWWLAGLAMQPIYQSYRQIQQFTADAAHELRTPLAAIRATVESTLRLQHIDETEARDTLSTVERQNDRLSQLVKDLLLLSRMDRPALAAKRIACNLQDIIGDIEEELAVLAVKADVKLAQDIRVKDSLSVEGDERQLYRMLYNLVANAIQYSSPGGKATVILDRQQQYALIRVKDSGIGIAPEERERIFDRFYRANSDRSRSSGGAGLGLPIAEAIARSHNGSIQVESELGKGSIFTIRLPLSRKGLRMND